MEKARAEFTIKELTQGRSKRANAVVVSVFDNVTRRLCFMASFFSAIISIEIRSEYRRDCQCA